MIGNLRFFALYSIIIFLLFPLGTSLTLHAQKKMSKVHYIADKTSFDQKKNPDAKLLKGHVKFVHDDIVMYCDSAYFYDLSNSLYAYGNVHIIRGDTLHIYSDQLYYQGNIKLAQFRNHVKLFNDNGAQVITTDSLNYDRVLDVATYFVGGKLVDTTNTLTSVDGEYHPQTKMAYFHKKVVLNNAKIDLFSDTLTYNTDSKIATIYGPTNIYTKDTTHIYAEKGFYNTQNRFCELEQKAVIYSKEHTIKANKLQYNEQLGDMHAYGNMSILDTLKHTIIQGEEGYFNKKTKYAMAKKKALCVEFSTPDTFYIHADQFIAKPDSIYKLIYGFHHVRFYRDDIQGKCDSLVVISRDSLVKMYQDPVLWADNNQISGDLIDIYSKNKNIDRLVITNQAFIITAANDSSYNQIKGTKITGYLKEKELKRMEVEGSVQCIYYMIDKDSTAVGINTSQCSFMRMNFNRGRIDTLIMKPRPTGTVFPPDGLEKPDRFLRGYHLQKDVRPAYPMDVFRDPTKTPKPNPKLVRKPKTKNKHKHTPTPKH